MTDQLAESACATAPPTPARTSSATIEQYVTREMDGRVAVLTMQLAPHNLLGLRLMGDLLAALTWATESGARCIVLRSGLRHFSAGAELEAFESSERGEAPDLPLLELIRAFEAVPVPIVASVHGIAVGGGLELALAADLVVAAESAKLGCVEVSLGLAPLMGAVQRITQRAGAVRAREITMLGRRFDARTLERWNIINRVVADDDLHSVTMTLAHELAGGPTVALASIKTLVAITERDGVGAADDRMIEVQAEIWKTQDLKDGIASLNTKGPGFARFEGR